MATAESFQWRFEIKRFPRKATRLAFATIVEIDKSFKGRKLLNMKSFLSSHLIKQFSEENFVKGAMTFSNPNECSEVLTLMWIFHSGLQWFNLLVSFARLKNELGIGKCENYVGFNNTFYTIWLCCWFRIVILTPTSVGSIFMIFFVGSSLANWE